MATRMRLVVRDVIQALRLWPIWLQLGLQDIRLRFRRSVLGVGWIFINLAVVLLAIGVVYGKLLGKRWQASCRFSLSGWWPGVSHVVYH